MYMATSTSSVTNNSGLSNAMEGSGQWVFSQGIPTDITVQVGEATFALHKLMLLGKSNYIRKRIMESEERDLSRIDLSGIPGGPEIFEKAAKLCYGVNFEITVQNVAALRCAAEYLEMNDGDGNLSRRTEDFLGQVALKGLSGAVAVLRSCEDLLPFAEDLNIVQRCVDVAGIKACNEATFPSRSPPNWWMEELSVLSIASLTRVIRAMTANGAKTSAIASTLTTYAEMWILQDQVRDPSSGIDQTPQQRKLLESIIALLPSDNAPFPLRFLCRLLRSALLLEPQISSKKELEKRISAVLDQATVDDLLEFSCDGDGERLLGLDSVERIISGFAEMEKSVAVGDVRVAGGEGRSAAMLKVAKTMDAYLGQIATYSELSISVFNGIAILVPKAARTVDDDLYRAIDIYLKAHPSLDEIEREKACSAMDPLRLSYEARVHASQNKRLPVQVVLHALYYDQLKVRSGGAPNAPRRNSMNIMPQPRFDDSARSRLQSDVALIRENESLRSELMKMKSYISDIQKSQGGSASTAASSVAPPKRGSSRKMTFFSSMSKTFGKLNPFRHGRSKDTSNIEDDDAVDLTKPRKRRFSIS